MALLATNAPGLLTTLHPRCSHSTPRSTAPCPSALALLHLPLALLPCSAPLPLALLPCPAPLPLALLPSPRSSTVLPPCSFARAPLHCPLALFPTRRWTATATAPSRERRCSAPSRASASRCPTPTAATSTPAPHRPMPEDALPRNQGSPRFVTTVPRRQRTPCIRLPHAPASLGQAPAAWAARAGYIVLQHPTGLCFFSDPQVLPPAFDAFANDEQLQPRGVKRPRERPPWS